MAKIVLDSSVLIALLDATDLHHGAAAKATAMKNTYFISAITLSESLIAPYSVSQVVGDSIKGKITKLMSDVVSVDAQVATEAAKIRAKKKISLPDAIISATAVLINAQLWSCDNDLVRAHSGAKKI